MCRMSVLQLCAVVVQWEPCGVSHSQLRRAICYDYTVYASVSVAVCRLSRGGVVLWLAASGDS